jgi:hypothetical protein
VKAISIFLLVCFTAVLTPKHWWHHCGHTAHGKESALTSDQTLDEKCAVCDLSLSVFTRPSDFSFFIFKQKPFVHGQLQCLLISLDSNTQFQLRAPPVV